MLWLFGRQLKSKNPAVRRKAVAQLGQGPRSIRILALALADEDREVRRLAAMALGKIEDEDCLEPLKAAIQDQDSEVVKAAILALKKTPNAVTMVPALTPLLR